MMRKINIFLILVSIIGSLYFVITKDTNIIFVLKDISIIFTINLLYIIKGIFKIKINDGINFIYILFIFMSHFLGVTCELYGQIFWYDKFIHFLSGIITSFIAIYILEKIKNRHNLLFNILFIIAFSLMVASLWEIFEYLSSYYFNVDPQRVALTGVSDTMKDIIVAFLGSILISLSYYFENTEGYQLLTKKFINQL